MFDSIIAKEGRKYILFAFIATIIFILLECGLLAFFSFAIFLFLSYLYRYKYVDFTAFKKNELIAPISGTITAIDVKDLKKSIYIDVSLFDSHILRSLEESPCEITTKRGLNLPLSSFKAKILNEQSKLVYTNSTMELYSSIFNPSIEIANRNFKKGEKIGTFLQGQIVITLDKDFTTYVNIGDKVISGKSLLAKKE